MDAKNLLLDIKNMHTSFKIKGEYYDAVEDISLQLKKDEVLAIVGESGCGKSTLATTIMGLHDMNYTKCSGEILYNGENLLNYTENQYNKIRGGEIGMIFQDPLSSLNPLVKIGKQIEEALIYHTKLNKEERRLRVLDLLQQVGIQDPERMVKQFPHELSGGMRQRVIIAIALSCNPNIVIADEPTTALDVTIQAQILDMLDKLKNEFKVGIIFITHDLGVVSQMADRVAVMYAGQIVELADVKELFSNPKHPYTRSLLKSIPQLDQVDDELYVIKGMVPSLKNLQREGCRFAERTPWIPKDVHKNYDKLTDIGNDHFVRCECWKSFHFED